MGKALLNEAERYLVERWSEARLLEASMAEVRAKYKELIQRIVAEIKKTHNELTSHVVYLTQSWTTGQVAFARSEWPSNSFGSPAGLWVENLRLKVLTAEDAQAPAAYVWIPKKAEVDFEQARILARNEAARLLDAEDFARAKTPKTGETLLVLPAPSKKQTLSALTDGDGEAFVKLFVAQFDMMARFVPVLDKVFRECVIKE